MKLKILIACAVTLIILIVLALRPVPIPDERDCLQIGGIVTEIYKGGVNDIVFELKGRKNFYYINRGLERGFKLSKLRNELLGKEVVIKYPRYWSPLDPIHSGIHISKIEHDRQTVFTELD